MCFVHLFNKMMNCKPLVLLRLSLSIQQTALLLKTHSPLFVEDSLLNQGSSSPSLNDRYVFFYYIKRSLLDKSIKIIHSHNEVVSFVVSRFWRRERSRAFWPAWRSLPHGPLGKPWKLSIRCGTTSNLKKQCTYLELGVSTSASTLAAPHNTTMTRFRFSQFQWNKRGTSNSHAHNILSCYSAGDLRRAKHE